MSVTAEHVRDVFRRYCELVTAGDADAVARLYAEDAVVEDPVGSSLHRGRDAIREFYRASAGSVRLELEGRVRTAGNEGAAAMIARPVADPSLRIETLDVMTFGDDGLVTAMRAWWSADTIHRD
jgi:steroid delta-isomerase